MILLLNHLHVLIRKFSFIDALFKDRDRQCQARFARNEWIKSQSNLRQIKLNPSYIRHPSQEVKF